MRNILCLSCIHFAKNSHKNQGKTEEQFQIKEVYKNRTHEVRLDLFAIKRITGALSETKTKILTWQAWFSKLLRIVFLQKYTTTPVWFMMQWFFPPRTIATFYSQSLLVGTLQWVHLIRNNLKITRKMPATKSCNFCDSVKCEILLKMSRHQVKVLK